MKPAVKIDHYATLDWTPALKIALRGQLELADSGGAQEVGLHYSFSAITASIDDEVVGVVVWHEQKESRRIWLQLGYVLPDWRGRGIYTQLWNALIDKARDLKVPAIWSGTSVDNMSLRSIAKRQGRREVAISLQFDVPGAS